MAQRLGFIACFFAGALALSAQAIETAPVDFQRDVFPVLQKHCVACHTADEAQGGLVMETFAELMKGGDSGPSLTPGVAASSRLFLMASGKMEPVMPPDDAPRPSEDELARIAAWIEQGAEGPDGDVPIRRELRTPRVMVSDDVDRPVTAIAVSVDGPTRAVARFGRVEIVSEGAKATRELEPQPGKVNSLRFSRDHSRLLVASGVAGLYGRAAIYEIATGVCLTEMIGHSDVMQVAIFSPDERTVATASYDRDIALWDAESGSMLRTIRGHNGAVNSLAFSADGSVLVSGSADETVKVWHAASGRRLDTMSQPTGEVHAVAITVDDRFVVAGSSDNRLRVWRLDSREQQRINPILATRFIDESPLTHLALTRDGSRVVVVSDSGNVKLVRVSDWTQSAVLEPLGETASDLALSGDDSSLWIALMNGTLVERALPPVEDPRGRSTRPRGEVRAGAIEPIYLETGPLKKLVESQLSRASQGGEFDGPSRAILLPRGAEVEGVIEAVGEDDWYAWDARRGEMWVVETDTQGLGGKIDTCIEIRDASGDLVEQVRLQAVRDSYFTFRGKDSTQTGDFRLFAWEEMKLDEFLYSAGEVVKLWMAPRGADSGFDVYPGMGNRWTYFGTSGTTHALGEPAYIVRPLAEGESSIANGLPVFSIGYANDDDPLQTRGKDSRLIFRTPEDGRYWVRVFDTRGEGGEEFRYRLRVRPADPSFSPGVVQPKLPLPRGAGREVIVTADPIDGFEGEVTFEIEGLPPGVHSNFPVVIEPGQNHAVGALWTDDHVTAWEGEVSPRVIARARIGNRVIEREAGVIEKLTLGERPRARIHLVPKADSAEEVGYDGDWTLRIPRGETVTLMVVAEREEGFAAEISLGKELAARNAPHGVHVDNIGLNGLLIRQGESEREFFVTANAIARPGKRSFFLTGAIDGGVTSRPITLEVVE